LSKIWAPSISGPPKKIFSGKQKFFPENVGEGGSTIFFSKTKVLKIFRKTNSRIFQHFQPTIPSFFLNFAIPPGQGPLPASWAPLFYFFLGGCYTPSHPPRWHGPDSDPSMNLTHPHLNIHNSSTRSYASDEKNRDRTTNSLGIRDSLLGLYSNCLHVFVYSTVYFLCVSASQEQKYTSRILSVLNWTTLALQLDKNGKVCGNLFF
jgi:hypothetical protein